MTLDTVELPVVPSYGTSHAVVSRTFQLNADSGQIDARTRWSSPLRRYDLSWIDVSRLDALSLKNFYQARLGSRPFEFIDVLDNAAVDQALSGSGSSWQLCKRYGSAIRPIYRVSSLVIKDGVTVITPSVNSFGLVTHSPASVLTASFSFKVCLRFDGEMRLRHKSGGLFDVEATGLEVRYQG